MKFHLLRERPARPGRLAYATLATAILLTLAPAALTGCDRFGNKSETILRGYDTISGYYGTGPQSMKIEARVNGSLRSQNVAVSSIPAELTEVMTHPVLLYFDDPVGGDGSVRSSANNGIGYGFKVTPETSSFAFSGQASEDVSGCVLTQDVARYGGYSQYATPVPVNGFSTRGRLHMSYESGYSFTGDDASCSVLMQDFEDCYIDPNQCLDGISSDVAHAFFDLYVMGGVLNASEISDTRVIRYTATYQ